MRRADHGFGELLPGQHQVHTKLAAFPGHLGNLLRQAALRPAGSRHQAVVFIDDHQQLFQGFTRGLMVGFQVLGKTGGILEQGLAALHFGDYGVQRRLGAVEGLTDGGDELRVPAQRQEFGAFYIYHCQLQPFGQGLADQQRKEGALAITAHPGYQHMAQFGPGERHSHPAMIDTDLHHSLAPAWKGDLPGHRAPPGDQHGVAQPAGVAHLHWQALQRRTDLVQGLLGGPIFDAA